MELGLLQSKIKIALNTLKPDWDTKRKWKVVTYAAYFSRTEIHFRLSGFPGQPTRSSSKDKLGKIHCWQREKGKMTASWAFRLRSKQNKLRSNFYYIGTEASAPEYVVQEGKWEQAHHMLYNHRPPWHAIYLLSKTPALLPRNKHG